MAKFLKETHGLRMEDFIPCIGFWRYERRTGREYVQELVDRFAKPPLELWEQNIEKTSEDRDFERRTSARASLLACMNIVVYPAVVYMGSLLELYIMQQ